MVPLAYLLVVVGLSHLEGQPRGKGKYSGIPPDLASHRGSAE